MCRTSLMALPVSLHDKAANTTSKRGPIMRNVFILFLLVSIVLLLATPLVADDENSTSLIAVKGSQKASGVITLQISQGTKSLELNCNEGMSGCADLKKGNYRMLVLPKNRGMYDCQNVRVFAESSTDPDNDEKLGEYCLAGK
jgi:hypothetical protein